MIGTFGTINFEVSNGAIFTPADENIQASCKITTKESTSGKPTTSASVPELRTYKFILKVSRALGIDAQAAVDKWLQMAEAGTTGYVNMGGKPLSAYQFKLKSVAVSDIQRNGAGVLLSAKLACEFQEYVVPAASAKKKKKAAKPKTATPTGAAANPYKLS